MSLKSSVLFLFTFSFVLMASVRCHALKPIELTCSAVLRDVFQIAPDHKFRQVKSLKVASLNASHLYLENTDDYGLELRLQESGKQKPFPKPEKEVHQILDLMKEEDPDIIILQEVYGVRSLELFSEMFGSGVYRPLMIEGNDPAGSNIGFLVKADLPFQFELLSFKNRTYVSDIKKQKDLVHSRDLPILLARGLDQPVESRPLFAIAGVHGKAQHSKSSGPNQAYRERLRRIAVEKRVAQLEDAGLIFTDVLNSFPRLPILFGGDFNVNPVTLPEFLKLRTLGFKDVFHSSEPTYARITLQGQVKLGKIDTFLASPSIVGAIEKAWVGEYKDESGIPKPLPKTPRDVLENPSGHFPIFTIIDLRPLSLFLK